MCEPTFAPLFTFLNIMYYNVVDCTILPYNALDCCGLQYAAVDCTIAGVWEPTGGCRPRPDLVLLGSQQTLHHLPFFLKFLKFPSSSAEEVSLDTGLCPHPQIMQLGQ